MNGRIPPAALALVLSSALLHAMWNLLLSRAPRSYDASAVGNALGLLALTPLALLRWQVAPSAWPYVLVSAAFQVVYYLVLNRAYVRAPAHAAYPIARGAAPVLLLLLAVFSGAPAPPLAVLGVASISIGVLLTASGANGRARRAALPVAGSLAGYTFVTSAGLHHADPAAYLWLAMIPMVVGGLSARAVVARGFTPLRAQLNPATFTMGAGMLGAHGLALAALSLVPPAQVPAIGALRETGILFVVAFSWLTTRRHGPLPSSTPARLTSPTPRTTAGAVLVFTGVALLAIT